MNTPSGAPAGASTSNAPLGYQTVVGTFKLRNSCGKDYGQIKYAEVFSQHTHVIICPDGGNRQVKAERVRLDPIIRLPLKLLMRLN